MAFRADEAARIGYEEVEAYLVPRPRDADEAQRARSKEALRAIVDELGPVVDAYPSWHPLVWNHDNRHPSTSPTYGCGYSDLDHTRLFANGFITCPYGDKWQKVIDSVKALPFPPAATITAERLDVQLYNPNATPVLVRCNWNNSLDEDGMIPLSIAMPLLLEKEVPCWQWAQVAETWETMRPYFLGRPHGSRSSLFVNQETGQAMKRVWNALIGTGMFGPIKV
ncbi:MAG: hypothetical protein CMK46_11040 [Porticoccus sp.]|uniref:hypothetical protein n=1 Tax=Porticoccus hydrocarbonoclasticus TaxID=1073414 RepID=UPI000C4AAC61|nr:hypothetical protein [Porticoccus hydrocarbonoclasticus]MBG58802.1 hypothetical protein [Porticoccus sp.]|tara:strand:+ start:4811 stop:5482 length:672 start_codon:yes stop_codon:yes gene_type:complete